MKRIALYIGMSMTSKKPAPNNIFISTFRN